MMNVIYFSYNEHQSINTDIIRHTKPDYSSRMSHATDTGAEDSSKEDNDIIQPVSTTSQALSDTGFYEDWFGSEVVVPRNSDRVMEQFGVMMLRIGAYLTKEGTDLTASQLFDSRSIVMEHRKSNLDCTAMPPDDTETPPLVGSSQERTASYLRDYPQIFRRKPSDIPLHSDMALKLTPDDKIATTSTASPSDLGISVETETEGDSKKISNKETTQKKLLTMSSDKSVTFKTVKSKVTSTQREKNAAKHKEAGTSKSSNNKTTDLEEKDSLESIIEDLKKRQSLKIKSYNKDENNNKAGSSKPTQNKKSSVVVITDDESSDSMASKKSNIVNRKNKNNTKK